MKPLELTIEGLYSYQNRQTIDFTKLTSAGLFGIFGTVGSGKSSILEAITYAIYGRTDKLNQSGDNRNYNMMNLKSNELFIDFIFETGKEQARYKSTVRGRRNSKRFEDVKAFERRAFKEHENEWLPIEVTDLEKAVGLSYENFKRTIIIPQGQFQEFLQLGNKDRTQMMKELFNLQKYEFYYKVVSLENKNNSQMQLINGQLQQLGTLDPDKVEVYNKQLKELETNIKEQNLKLVAFQKAEEQLRGLLDKIQKRDESQKALNSLLQQQPEFTKLEMRITRYEQSVAAFKHLLKSLNE
ncbi:MAG TPA: AAA family ATPase, partial [Bacteroidales bacterium]|nr:AAA family ATPase [Bacteroidales bacterium]